MEEKGLLPITSPKSYSSKLGILLIAFTASMSVKVLSISSSFSSSSSTMGLCVSDAYPSNADASTSHQFTDPVYSLPLLPPSDDASTSIYRNIVCKSTTLLHHHRRGIKSLSDSLVSVPMLAPEVTTLPALLEYSYLLCCCWCPITPLRFAGAMNGQRPFLGARHGPSYCFMTYRDFCTPSSSSIPP